MLFLLLSILSLVIFFFFLMIRRPPRSTLFPTRRSSDLHSSSSRWNGELEEAGLVERQLLRRSQARGRPHRLVEKRARDPQPGARRRASLPGGLYRQNEDSQNCPIRGTARTCRKKRALSGGRRMVRGVRRW